MTAEETPSGAVAHRDAGRSPLTEEFEAFVRQKLDKWKVPGMSLAVIDGEDVYAKGYGYATLPDIPATPQTVWYCASTTKAHTAAALSKLIHAKRHAALSGGWPTTLSSVLRGDFVLQDEWATDHVTLEDAAVHRTGMARHDKSSAREADGKQVTPRDVVRNLRNLSMMAEPRSTFYYCNFMYVALSHVIETVTGSSLGSVLRDLIWDPLGMKSTFLDLEEARKADGHFADGYYWDKEAEEYRLVDYMTVGEVSGAGGAFSTVLDYAKWVKCLLYETEPLSKDVHKDIKKPRSIASTVAGGGLDISLYSLGWQRTLYKGHVVFTHGGGMHAYGSQVYWLPDAKFGVVAFGNTALTSNAVEDVVIYRLIERKLGIPEENRFDFDKAWEERIKAISGDIQDPVKKAYPNRPDTAIPSSFTIGELVGSYNDAGYGTFTFREEAHPDKPDEKILVADRPELTWRLHFRVQHAFADYWVVKVTTPLNPTLLNECHPAQFKRGTDGKVAALEIEWASQMGNMCEGLAIFKRVPDEESHKD